MNPIYNLGPEGILYSLFMQFSQSALSVKWKASDTIYGIKRPNCQ